jgi:hypothetical protein
VPVGENEEQVGAPKCSEKSIELYCLAHTHLGRVLKKLPAFATAQRECFPYLEDDSEDGHACWIKKATLNHAMMDSATADRDDEAEEHAAHGSQYKMNVPTEDFLDDRQLFVQERTQLIMDCGLCLAKQKNSLHPGLIPPMPRPTYMRAPDREIKGDARDCLEEDIRMFCLENTFAGHFFKHSPTFHSAERACFPHLDLDGTACKIGMQDLNGAYLSAMKAEGGARRSNYLEARERMVTKCDVCLGANVRNFIPFHDGSLKELESEENAGFGAAEPAAPAMPAPGDKQGDPAAPALPNDGGNAGDAGDDFKSMRPAYLQNNDDDDNGGTERETGEPVQYEVVSYAKMIVAKPYLQASNNGWVRATHINPGHTSLEDCEQQCRDEKRCKFGTYVMEANGHPAKCWLSSTAAESLSHWNVDDFLDCNSPCVSFVREQEAQGIYVTHRHVDLQHQGGR